MQSALKLQTKKKIPVYGEYIIIYATGATAYTFIEILWRGFTHWTMTLTGGLCFLCIYFADKRLDQKKKSIWAKCSAGSAVITAVEFIVGCVVNRVLKWNVWDYSNLFLNLMGQVCPLYAALWFFLCIPAVYLCKFIRNNIFG